MKTSESIEKLHEALAKAQAKIKPAEFDCVNPHFNSKYASLASCWSACREPLSTNGLSVIQGIDVRPDGAYVVSRLGHSSGQWIECEILLHYDKTRGMQSMGSALTYAKRYLLSSMVGVVADSDDDANSAGSTKGQTNTKNQPNNNQKSTRNTPASNQKSTSNQPDLLWIENKADFSKSVLNFGTHKGMTFNDIGPENLLFILEDTQSKAKNTPPKEFVDLLKFVKNWVEDQASS